MATAIAITSGKGGTGKTSLTGGIGSCLAALGKRVLCIDMDIGLRNLDLALGLSDRALMDFTDVIQGRCGLGTAAVAHPDIPSLFLLTAPLFLPRDRISVQQMRALVALAKQHYDYILMDAPAGLGIGFQLAAAAADRVIVVTTSDASALRDAQRTVSELTRAGAEHVHLVVNRVQAKLLNRLHTSIDHAMDTAGLPLLGVVPEDAHVTLAMGEGKPLVLTSRRGAALACLNISRRLMGQRVPLMRIR